MSAHVHFRSVNLLIKNWGFFSRDIFVHTATPHCNFVHKNIGLYFQDGILYLKQRYSLYFQDGILYLRNSASRCQTSSICFYILISSYPPLIKFIPANYYCGLCTWHSLFTLVSMCKKNWTAVHFSQQSGQDFISGFHILWRLFTFSQQFIHQEARPQKSRPSSGPKEEKKENNFCMVAATK